MGRWEARQLPGENAGWYLWDHMEGDWAKPRGKGVTKERAEELVHFNNFNAERNREHVLRKAVDSIPEVGALYFYSFQDRARFVAGLKIHWQMEAKSFELLHHGGMHRLTFKKGVPLRSSEEVARLAHLVNCRVTAMQQPNWNNPSYVIPDLDAPQFTG